MNVRPSNLLATLALGAIALSGFATGCELIASVDRSQIPGDDGGISSTGGAGGNTSTGGSGGTTSVGGHGGTGGIGGTGGTGGTGGASCVPACKDPVEPDCETITCDNGTCTSTFQPNATKLPDAKQTAGNCKAKACDGAGKVVDANDDADVPDDKNDCTTDSCTGGVAKNDPVATGAACATNGGTVCDGAGTCVACNVDADCKDAANPSCDKNKCVPAGCKDGKKNGDETDVDCGGSCNGCDTDQACIKDADCLNLICTNLKCAAAACDDGIKNGTESDIDCGGSCTGCGPSQKCGVDGDCTGKQCDAGTHTCALNCADGVLNNNETDIDCGGDTCDKCADGSGCKAPGDCSTNGCCDAPAGTCSTCCDGVKDGTESDLDCGGSCALKCADNAVCNGNGDCLSALCQAFTCKPSTCSNGALDVGESDIDCGGPCQPCTQGKLCGANPDCASGFCTDGVCCNVACGGLCEACIQAKTGLANGGCQPVTTNTDPDAECAQDAAATCKQNGMCDGAKACAKYDANTECVAASCAAGTQTNQSKCDGKGVCPVAGTVACTPYICGAAACASTCADDTGCIAGDFCDLAANPKVCKPKLAPGGVCAGNNQCANGICVDGFCCNTVCNGTCQACSAVKTGGSNGTCAAVTINTDPDNECAQDAASTCGQTGACNGANACAKYDNATVCAGPACAAGIETAQRNCDGSGTCVAGVTTACTPFICGAAACKASCAADTDCVDGDFCETPGANGVCKPKLAQGGVCIGNNQCANSICADGFCCNTVCNTLCEACSAAKTGAANGTCAPMSANTDPDNECAGAAGAEMCGAGNKCQCSDALKDGTAAAAETDVDCGGSVCGKCAQGLVCVSDTDCIAADYCDGTKHCAAKLADGGACTGNNECANNVCTGSLCYPALCGNAAVDPPETDLNCGGGTCPKCALNKVCVINADCAVDNCLGGVCLTPTCVDGVMNGAETDVDCGGASCGATCATGKTCLVNGDCLNGTCTANDGGPSTCN